VAGNGHAACNINYPIAIFIIFSSFVCYVGMVYGPVGAFLAEILPRQDSVYVGVGAVSHRNGWGGGLVPFITSSVFAPPAASATS